MTVLEKAAFPQAGKQVKHRDLWNCVSSIHPTVPAHQESIFMWLKACDVLSPSKPVKTSHPALSSTARPAVGRTAECVVKVSWVREHKGELQGQRIINWGFSRGRNSFIATCLHKPMSTLPLSHYMLINSWSPTALPCETASFTHSSIRQTRGSFCTHYQNGKA